MRPPLFDDFVLDIVDDDAGNCFGAAARVTASLLLSLSIAAAAVLLGAWV